MNTKKVIKFLRRMLRHYRYLKYVNRNEPVPFQFRARTFYLNPDHSAIYHIENSTSNIARMCELVEATPNNVFDVGANCGLFAAILTQKFPKSRIFCFEPSEELHPIIKKNCEQGNVSVYNYAIAENDELRTFYVNPRSQQTNSLNIEAVTLFASENFIKKQVVQCRSLDSIAKENKIECVEVLKVDVQGFEGAVFRGAKELLPTVEYLFVESTWIDIESISQILPFAIGYGFKFAAVVNPVYMGADILLTKKPLHNKGAADLVFALEEGLLTSCWR